MADSFVRACLITNPKSGRGGVDLSEALTVLQANGWDVTVRQKLKGGMAEDLAREPAHRGVHKSAGDGVPDAAERQEPRHIQSCPQLDADLSGRSLMQAPGGLEYARRRGVTDPGQPDQAGGLGIDSEHEVKIPHDRPPG